MPLTPLEPAPVQTPPEEQTEWRFTMPWVVWFNKLVAWIAYIQAQIDGLSPGLTNSYVTDGVTTGDAATVLSGGTSSLVSPTATPNAGDQWTAFLEQPAAGGQLVDLTGIVPDVHGLSVNGAGTINNVSRGASKITALSFICRADGDWWLTASEVLA